MILSLYNLCVLCVLCGYILTIFGFALGIMIGTESLNDEASPQIAW